MNSDTILDYARFQLSPRRTRCELFVSGGGKTAKLASGFLKPFLTHLKVAEEHSNHASQLIKLEVDKRKNAGTWFNKGTLERFVRFVSTPEVLELVNTFDAEMSQLEGSRKIYSQGAGDELSGENESAASASDITKKELLRAIDVRLTAVKQDLSIACARASAAGFTIDTVSELLLFADRFGALRLNEACAKFISLCQRRPELMSHQQSSPSLTPSQWKGFDDANIRSSSDSDMSIDEHEVEPFCPFGPSVRETGGTSAETYKPTTGQPLQKSVTDVRPIACSVVGKDTSKTKDDHSPRVASSDKPVQPATGGSRRLSVQDRINLFESKQKEQTESAGPAGVTSSSSGGGGINRAVAGKGEHRRLPSDASLEKAVLRRWSGASDMSIDLTNTNSFTSDRKESGSAVGTPSSCSNSCVQSVSKTEDAVGVLNDTATSLHMLCPKVNSTTSSSSSSFSSFQGQTISSAMNRERCDDDDGLLKEGTTITSQTQSEPYVEKGLGNSNTELGTFVNTAHQSGFSHEVDMVAGSKLPSRTGEDANVKDHTASLAQFDGVAVQNLGMKDQATSQILSRTVAETLVKAESSDQGRSDTVGVVSQTPSIPKFRKFAEKTEEGGAKQKVPLDSQLQSMASLGKVEGVTPQNELHSQAYWKTHPGNREGVSLDTGSGSRRMQPHGRTSIPDQMKKAQGTRDGRVPNQGTSITVFSVKKATEQEDVLQIPATPPVEQVQLNRPLKGNSELNDELQMKADELEKLFAAHKLRVHGDQTYSSRKSKTIGGQAWKSADKRPVEVFADQSSEGTIPTEILSNGVEFDSNLLLKMVDRLDSAHSMKQKLGTVSPSDDSRGKLYEKYMKKRDAKLREESGLKRSQKEAKMKAMHASLEHSQAEMKAKLAGSGDKRDSILTRRHADKIICSAIRNKGQTVEPLQGEEDLQELGQVVYSHERSYSDTLSGNESSTSCKKIVSNKSLSSSTLRTSAAQFPKPSAKATNSGSIKRRAQLENTLAQSVPSFSDLRKENTKPVAGPTKGTSCSQTRIFARSKSSTEEALLKEDKSRRSHSMRKSLAISGELKDLSPLSSDGANMTPLKSSNEQMEHSLNKIQSSELKQFLRKGNGIGPGAGPGIAKLKLITNTEPDEEDFGGLGLMDQREDSPDVDEGEEFDGRSADGNIQATDFPVDLNSENGDPGLENGDVLRSPSQHLDDSIDVSSKFNLCVENVPESTGGSPGSWNSNIHHLFSYAHEESDIDFSVDSPTGSPSSWNSHPLNQMVESDTARMRKKWGSAQIPVLVANVPHHPCKDVTKGFKRLLKFGRKSRGVEYIVNDWVSVSTVSEGDDDTEDVRDLGSQTSDELRKSRKGNSVSNYDGFNDGDTFPEQVQSLRSSIPNAPSNINLREDHLSGSSLKAPRSFFSLSSFRSKGSEAKPR